MRVGVLLVFFFFFQAEDGIRDLYVTGVQTCALPIFAGAIELDDRGFVPTGPAALYSDADGARRSTQRQPMMLETSQPGVFAAGDVRSGSVKRVASAVGEGSMAIRQIHEHFGG